MIISVIVSEFPEESALPNFRTRYEGFPCLGLSYKRISSQGEKSLEVSIRHLGWEFAEVGMGGMFAKISWEDFVRAYPIYIEKVREHRVYGESTYVVLALTAVSR